MALLAWLACGGSAPAQVQRTEAQSVLVDVLVTDKKGNPIPGLTERDFQVFEDGKEQMVDGLFTETGGATQSRQALILLFDNAAMTSREQGYARQLGTTIVDQFANSNANIAVLDFGGSLRVTQTFTSDVTRVKQALTKGSGSAMSADSLASVGASPDYVLRDLLNSLDGLAKNLQSATGRKTVVFFSPGYSMSGESQQRLNNVVGAANRSNVSFYPINTRIVNTSGNSVTDVSVAPAATGRVGRGISVPSPIQNPGTIESGPALLGFLNKLADSTGGFVVRQPDDRAALARVSKEQSEFYILSYTPPESPEGSCHKLRVKVKRDGVNLRAREGYCKRTPGALLSGNPKEKTLEAKALAAQSGNIAATMQAPYFYKGTNLARVAAVLEVQTTNLAFKKEKNKFVAQLDVLGIANLEDGSAGARFSDVVKLEFDTQAQVDAFKAKPYRYENQFDIAPGRYKLAVALGAGAESFAKLEAPLAIEPYTAGEFGLSGIALSHEYRSATASVPGLDEFLIDDRKKFVSEGVEVVVSGSSKFKLGGVAGIFVEIYEPLLVKPDPRVPLAVAFQMRVLDRATGAVKGDTGGLQLDLRGKQGQPSLPLALNLPVKDITSGAYTLELEVVDSANKTAKRSIPFEIE